LGSGDKRIFSSRPAWAIEEDPVSKIQKEILLIISS
jgi:hypothetical protein